MQSKYGNQFSFEMYLLKKDRFLHKPFFQIKYINISIRFRNSDNHLKFLDGNRCVILNYEII